MCICRMVLENLLNSKCVSSSIYWTGPFPGIKSPIEACVHGGGVCSLKIVNIKTKFILKR